MRPPQIYFTFTKGGRRYALHCKDAELARQLRVSSQFDDKLTYCRINRTGRLQKNTKVIVKMP